MAEQKIDDTKVPTAPRGARPFARPATASAARPFMRPAAPVARPSTAPFAPPSRGRPALGTVAAPAQADEIPYAAEAAERIDSEPRRRPVTSEMVALDAFDAFEAAWNGVDAIAGAATEAPASPPPDESALGTGSDGAHLWAEEIAVPPVGSPAGGSSLADPTLAAGSPDLEAAWPVAESATSESEMPAWLTDDTEVLSAGDPDVDWSDAPSLPSADDVVGQDVIVPAISSIEALGDAAAPSPQSVQEIDTQLASAEPASDDLLTTPAVRITSDAEPLPDALVAEYAPYIAASWETPAYLGVISAEPPEAHAVEVPMDIPSAGDASAPSVAAAIPPAVIEAETVEPVAVVDPKVAAGIRVSATLDRLAEQVRGGEIDISSVAPGATDAAVLASVLAALLGGSRSR